MATAPAPESRSRPLGVAILAVLIGLYGFLLILLGALILVGSAAEHTFGSALPYSFGTSVTIAGALTLVIGLIVLGLAVGLWHLRMWALVLTLLFLAFELISFGLAGAFVSVGFILSLILFLYLLAVSRHF
ncbi:MAG TPA: hypothetical protein VMG99_00615 [Thermoplasmata archaeon]|jgi:hypothetical protein|nr:hypothetical protein [Thermoplasmata archaeon]